VRERILIFLLLSVSVFVSGQVIDTTKKINTWKLMHNYTRFEEVPLDTSMHQLHRIYQPAYKEGFSYESLGIVGHGLNHVDFFLRPEADAFVFGAPWDPYLKTTDRTTFFNTKTPFTTLSYSTMFFVNQAPEENIRVLHTQNLSPFSNFGLDFNILSSKPYYNNEKTRSNRMGLFGSHAKDKYSIFGTFYFNDFKAEDHAGVNELDAFKAGSSLQPWEYLMQLTQAQSQYRNMSFFATQKYNLIERISTADSLGNITTTGKTLSLSYQLEYVRQFKSYSDNVNPEELSPVYNNYYYETPNAFDSVSEDKLSNVFQVILGDPDYDKISARVYAGYELRRFGALSPYPYSVFSHFDSIPGSPSEGEFVYRDSTIAQFSDTYFHDIYVGFNLAGPTTGTWDWVINGKYYLAGYYQNDFNVNATFSRKFLQRADLGLRGSFEHRRPHYFVNSYSSSFYRWENDFPSLLKIKGEAFVQSDEMEMELRASVAYLTNYQYWNELALPQVYDKDILIFSGYFSKHFAVAGFNSEDKLLVQYSTAEDILRLPAVVVYSSNYWRQDLFKGALIATLGFDVYLTSSYKASAYMPATGIFYHQNESDVGSYPFLDVFFAFKIARTRIFASYNNVLSGGAFLGNNYFTTYRYPMKPRHFRMGLVWTFYD